MQILWLLNSELNPVSSQHFIGCFVSCVSLLNDYARLHTGTVVCVCLWIKWKCLVAQRDPMSPDGRLTDCRTKSFILLFHRTISHLPVQTVTSFPTFLPPCSCLHTCQMNTRALLVGSLLVCQLARKCAAFTIRLYKYMQFPGKYDIQTTRVKDCWLRILLMFNVDRHKPWPVLKHPTGRTLSHRHRLLILQQRDTHLRFLKVPLKYFCIPHLWWHEAFVLIIRQLSFLHFKVHLQPFVRPLSSLSLYTVTV